MCQMPDKTEKSLEKLSVYPVFGDESCRLPDKLEKTWKSFISKTFRPPFVLYTA